MFNICIYDMLCHNMMTLCYRAPLTYRPSWVYSCSWSPGWPTVQQ